jgi:hypothetical protein
MAQLTDRCFAVSGPLMLLEEIERLIAERIVPAVETETVAFSPRSGAWSRPMLKRRSICRISTIQPLMDIPCAMPTCASIRTLR